jgi:phosphoglycerol transferase MdoB-like AlkP superfamily enzyme
VTFTYFGIPYALYAILVPDRIFLSRYHKPLVYLVFLLTAYLLLFGAVAEYLFFDEFGVRFNFIAVDYLIYTHEVIGNIKESYPVNWIFGTILAASILVLLLIKKFINQSLSKATTFTYRIKTAPLFIVLPFLSYALVDLSFANISQNSYAAELAGNGIYHLGAAFRNNELNYKKFYATKDTKLVLTQLRDLLKEKNNNFPTPDLHDITREIKNRGPEKRLNVIVIVEESLSAEYLGTFGNTQGLTPNLDKLAGQSLTFTHIYATGTRTVRGLEAITLSMPPMPGTSIIKRPGNENFFSWGSIMKERGYDNKFIYGGFGYFDNMNRFFAGNGFEVIDRNVMNKDEITFANIWGICDEDLFKRVIAEAGKSYEHKKPFFSVVMTTSNHRPFTYPDGRVDIPSHTGRQGGVKYADYALGRFIDEAQKQP